MEDSHIAGTNLDNNVQVFGVFDGHGGNKQVIRDVGCEVALYVKDKYVELLKNLPSFKSRDYPKALKESFIAIDELLVSPQGKRDILRYRKNEDTQNAMFGRPETDDISMFTGCTACVALITDTEIYCANSGDSRCVLSSRGTAIEMSMDHKPELPGERARIEKAGGFVEDNRVKGVLNLSRSLGDMEYKSDKSLTVENQMITCVPEIKVEKLNKNHDFLVIACDGIWDCLTSQECITMVSEFMESPKAKGPLSLCIEQMFDKIIASDVASSGKKISNKSRNTHKQFHLDANFSIGGIGCDNMTAVVIQLKSQ